MSPDTIITATIVETEQQQACALHAQADRCRRLAEAFSDTRTVTTLTGMAAEYEAQARELGHS